MTNEQIIWQSRLELMEKGIIGKTGRLIPVEDTEGKKSFIAEPEQIHTYMEWKRRGYLVRHGEKAVSKLSIWKHAPKRKGGENEEGKDKMFMKQAFSLKHPKWSAWKKRAQCERWINCHKSEEINAAARNLSQGPLVSGCIFSRGSRA